LTPSKKKVDFFEGILPLPVYRANGPFFPLLSIAFFISPTGRRAA
jgi:hypothetical protein